MVHLTSGLFSGLSSVIQNSHPLALLTGAGSVVNSGFDNAMRIHSRIQQHRGKNNRKYVNAESDADLLLSDAIIAGTLSLFGVCVSKLIQRGRNSRFDLSLILRSGASFMRVCFSDRHLGGGFVARFLFEKNAT